MGAVAFSSSVCSTCISCDDTARGELAPLESDRLCRVWVRLRVYMQARPCVHCQRNNALSLRKTVCFSVVKMRASADESFGTPRRPRRCSSQSDLRAWSGWPE
eukprot:1123683-Prymnesium_polylepis.2